MAHGEKAAAKANKLKDYESKRGGGGFQLRNKFSKKVTVRTERKTERQEIDQQLKAREDERG